MRFYSGPASTSHQRRRHPPRSRLGRHRAAQIACIRGGAQAPRRPQAVRRHAFRALPQRVGACSAPLSRPAQHHHAPLPLPGHLLLSSAGPSCRQHAGSSREKRLPLHRGDPPQPPARRHAASSGGAASWPAYHLISALLRNQVGGSRRSRSSASSRSTGSFSRSSAWVEGVGLQRCRGGTATSRIERRMPQFERQP